MKHYGDITKIDGAKVPIVDVICGGSPCQDLSVAGKRAGLAGERSGLFMEQIRIVKEQRNECLRQLQMRGADFTVRSISPRYLIWENVPGALSSGTPKGGDFRCVLEEICRIADQTATVPMPEKGKWSNSGLIVGDGWSVGWRVHDAQFWGRTVLDNAERVVKAGTPQRRRRISVVADFGSERVGEILFECESLPGDIEQSNQKGEEITRPTGKSSTKASNVFGDEIMPTFVARAASAVGNTQDGFNVISFQERAGCPGGGGKGILIQDEKTASIRTQNNQSVCYGIEPGAAQRLGGYVTEEKSPTLRANMGDNQVGVACYGMDNERRRGPDMMVDKSPTITAKMGMGGNNTPIVIEGNGSRPSHQGDGFKESEISYTLNSTEVHGVCAGFKPMQGSAAHGLGYEEEKAPTLNCSNNAGVITEEPILLANNQNGAEVSQTGICNTLPASAGMGGGYVPMITDTYQKTTGALCASGYDKLGTQEAMNDMYVIDCYNQSVGKETTKALTAISSDADHVPCVAYGLDRASFNQGQNAKYDFAVEEELSPTLVSRGPGGVMTEQ